jgi:hypothetical protein
LHPHVHDGYDFMSSAFPGRCKLIVGLLSQPPHPREAASIVPQTQIIQFLYM